MASFTARRVLAAFLLICLLVSAATVRADTNWPGFRGPLGTGHSIGGSLPTKWDAKNVTWKVKLPGRGQSSPSIWGERIFLTSAAKTDAGAVERYVYCVDRSTGKTLWKDTASSGPAESLHKMNMWATSTCATDGEHVLAFFGDGGLHCYTLDGKKVWSRELGKFPGSWGTAASPVILGDMVVQNCDAEGKTYLLAVEKKTGKQIWRTERRNLPKGGWSTPILIDTGKRKELILNGEYGVQSYNPTNGEEYWFCKGFNGRGTPMPAVGHGLVFVVNGKPGDIYAVRPGGKGDVTKTRMAWHTRRGGGRDLPSPILVGDYVFTVNMGGIGTCYDAVSGKELWQERLGGKFSASPIAVGGLIYSQSETGEMLVIKPGKKYQLIARNSLGEADDVFRASPAASDGQLFLRSGNALYCIGKRTPRAAE
ncbi:MAG: PQQ-binding-like beta-propeller repeat protein [Planctomycetes bacterium]|nr:PQQ-binding-like beta-propeller repeat protein [Planctomycetota bacterium]